jgi:hypothetical protein
MPLVTEPIQPSDVPAVVDTAIAAFDDNVNTLMFHTRPFSEESIEIFRGARLRALKAPNSRSLKCVDTETGEIIAAIRYSIHAEIEYDDRTIEELVEERVGSLGKMKEFNKELAWSFYKLLLGTSREVLAIEGPDGKIGQQKMVCK